MAQGRVAVLSAYPWSEPTGTTQSVTDFARYFTNAGVEVRVAIGPYDAQTKVWPEYQVPVLSSETLESMTIRRSWHYVRTSPSPVSRLLQETGVALFALPSIVRVLWRRDVAYIVSPAPMLAFVATVVATIVGVRRVLVVRNVMPDAAVELGMLRALVRVSMPQDRWVYPY